MLRPATPLSVLLFVAFVLLLLSVISTPIVKAIPLATYQGTDFGVFGYCKGSSCSGITVGYSTGTSKGACSSILSEWILAGCSILLSCLALDNELCSGIE